MAKNLSINIDVKFGGKKNAKAELEKLIASIPQKSRKIELLVDTKNLKQTFREVASSLKEINKQIKETFDMASYFAKQNKEIDNTKNKAKELREVFETSQRVNENTNLGEYSYKSFQTRLGQIKAQMSDIKKMDITQGDDGKIEKAVITYTDKIGKAIKETMGWKKVVDDATGEQIMKFQTLKTVGVNAYEAIADKAKSVDSKKTSSQDKIDSLRVSGNLNDSYIKSLQKELDKLDTTSAASEFTKLNQEISKASKQSALIEKINSELNKTKNTVAELQAKGGKTKNSASLSQINEYVKKLEGVKSLLAKGSDSVNKDVVTRNLSNLTKALKDYTKETNSVIAQNKVLNGSFATMGDAFKQFAAKIGMYGVIHSAINKITESLKEGVEAVKAYDSAIATLNMTMSDVMSRGQVEYLAQQAQVMADELSTSTGKVLEAIKTVANAGETIESMQNKAAPAVILSNITGMDVSKTVDTIQSAVNQFHGLAAATEKDAMKVADSMTKMSASMGLDFGRGIIEISESLKIMGSLSDQLGQDMDETMAVIGTGMEKLRLSGSEVANSIEFCGIAA